MSQGVSVRHVTMRFDQFTALNDVSLEIKKGTFFSILGPSGCGKTTLLKIISGFLEPTEGELYIGERNMKGIGANKRPTALIFQNLALFPLMSVGENIGFGLEARGIAKAERRKRVDALLETVSLTEYGDQPIEALSGGQKQRVAIARALAVEPDVLLLDEPLSALDLKLRQHMRQELRALQKQTGVTFIYITHDQGEALTMSDEIAVMNHGVVEQVSDVCTLYNAPKTPFVASFVGENNRFSGTVQEVSGETVSLETPYGVLQGSAGESLRCGEEVCLFVRPERIRLEPAPGERDATLSLRLQDISFEGAFSHLHFYRHDTEQAQPPIVVHKRNAPHERSVGCGEEAALYFDARDALVLRNADA